MVGWAEVAEVCHAGEESQTDVFNRKGKKESPVWDGWVNGSVTPTRETDQLTEFKVNQLKPSP